MEPVLLWLRRDLRIGGNPALAAVVKTSRPIIPVFIRPAPILDHDDARKRALAGYEKIR